MALPPQVFEMAEGVGVRKSKREYGAELRAQIEADRHYLLIRCCCMFTMLTRCCGFRQRKFLNQPVRPDGSILDNLDARRDDEYSRFPNIRAPRIIPEPAIRGGDARPRSADMRPRSAGRASGAAARAEDPARRSGWEAQQGQLPDRVQELLLGLHSRLATLEAVASSERTEVHQARARHRE